MTYSEMNYRMGQEQSRQQYEAYLRNSAGPDFSNVRYRGEGRATVTSNLAPDHWSIVLGVSQFATKAEINTAYRKLARSAHPDAGGSVSSMAKLNAARDAALKEVTP